VVRRVPGILSVVDESMIIRESSVLPADTDAVVARRWFPSK
jgi:hypothetical protein